MYQNQDFLKTEQYKNASNLQARIALHQRFSTSTISFPGWVFEKIQAPSKARILELGTGSGNLWQMNREHIPEGWEITLSDLSEGMLEDAKRNLKDVRTFRFEVIDAQHIPFASQSFDVVIANHMLYHVPDVDKAISEVGRVLKLGGHFYAATNSLDHMKELDDFVEEHMASGLPGVFERMTAVTEHFALENGMEKLRKHFPKVKIHMPPESHLQVTEAQPFVDYILSMARWSTLVKGISEAQVDSVVKVASSRAEAMLPIRVTTSAGLFEAWIRNAH